MTNLITTVEHAFATAARDVVAVGKFVQSHVLPVLKEANANAATVEAVTGLISPQAANVERVAFAILAKVIAAVDSGSTAATAGGLSITLDEQFISDVKAILPTVKSQAALATAAVALA